MAAFETSHFGVRISTTGTRASDIAVISTPVLLPQDYVDSTWTSFRDSAEQSVVLTVSLPSLDLDRLRYIWREHFHSDSPRLNVKNIISHPTATCAHLAASIQMTSIAQKQPLEESMSVVIVYITNTNDPDDHGNDFHFESAAYTIQNGRILHELQSHHHIGDPESIFLAITHDKFPLPPDRYILSGPGARQFFIGHLAPLTTAPVQIFSPATSAHFGAAWLASGFVELDSSSASGLSFELQLVIDGQARVLVPAYPSLPYTSTMDVIPQTSTELLVMQNDRCVAFAPLQLGLSHRIVTQITSLVGNNFDITINDQSVTFTRLPPQQLPQARLPPHIQQPTPTSTSSTSTSQSHIAPPPTTRSPSPSAFTSVASIANPILRQIANDLTSITREIEHYDQTLSSSLRDVHAGVDALWNLQQRLDNSIIRQLDDFECPDSNTRAARKQLIMDAQNAIRQINRFCTNNKTELKISALAAATIV